MIKNAIPLRIAGVGYSVPETVITNDDLTKLYETSDEWIYTRTGIKERRVVSGNQNAIDLGFEAAKRALDKAKISPDEIDLIIAASSAPPDLYPAIACHIHQRLGITKPVPAFDITAACSGLIYGMSIAKAYINSGMYKKSPHKAGGCSETVSNRRLDLFDLILFVDIRPNMVYLYLLLWEF